MNDLILDLGTDGIKLTKIEGKKTYTPAQSQRNTGSVGGAGAYCRAP
jgi:hypothetical protein